jgi:protein-L-isoaspartate O-methyltransferase
MLLVPGNVKGKDRRKILASHPFLRYERTSFGGRLVSPLEQAGGGQALVVVDRHEEGYDRRVHEAVRFVPLKSGLSR